MNIDEKLNKFESICIEMSNKDKANLQKELDEKAKSKIEKELTAFNKKLEDKFEKEKVKLEKEYNKKIIECELTAKKQLLDEEEKEKKEIFENCVQKLKDYTFQEEYIDLLQQAVKNVSDFIERDKNIIIYLTAKDAKRLTLKGNVDVEILEDTYIGGFILKSENIIIDNTFLTNLKEKLYGTKENN